VTAQGSDIVIDDATTSTQNNIAITNQHSGQTNSALVLSPKGAGALIAQKPNGATSGGNARGNYAVDLQLERGAATHVASGTNSTVSGGYGNSATSNWSTVSGGYQNQSATGQSAVVSGGTLNKASGSESFLGGGRENEVTGQYAMICGGNWGLANRVGMHAHAIGRFSAAGDAQRARFVLRNKTTTNAAVELFLDGSSTRLTIPSGKYLTGTINIAGIKSDGTAAASYIRQFSIKNVAGTTSLVGTVNTIGTDEAASTSISITANDTNDALKVEATGIASETWRWVAAVDVVEVAYGS
jgi:hypothetical protein